MINPSEGIAGFKNGLAGIVHSKNISEDSGILEGFSADLDEAGGKSPWLLVYPETREQVQGIVRLANEYATALIPVSSGPPRFRGDTVPEKEGVIVDFSRMKRILRIDSESRYVMIEPGVTYGELIPELREHGLRLNMPLLPRESKSVVTSLLEREPGLIPKYQYDYVDPLLTLEVVYGTGDDLRTGSASGPGTLETLKADKVNPWGPGSVDFFRLISGAQGTMGFVTWAIAKTEILPSLRKLYFIPIEEVKHLTSPINVLLRRRVIDECLALNNHNLATILIGDRPAEYGELKKDLPPWTVIVCVAGYQRRPEERVSMQEKHLISACDELGINPKTTLPGAGGMESGIPDLLSNPWKGEPYWKLLNKDGCRDIFFLSPLSQVAKFIGLMKKTAHEHGYSPGDMGCYIQPMVQGRGCHCEFTIPYDPSNRQESARVDRLFMDASKTLLNHGAFFSRPYGPWADMVYDPSVGDVGVLKKLKGIFDPNHILNPGKLCF